MDNLTTIKRIIYISAGVIILGLLIYVFYPRTKPPAPTTETKTGKYVGKLGNGGQINGEGGVSPDRENSGQTLTGSEEKLVKITDFAVVSPSLNKKEDQILFYKKDGGDLISYDIAGKKQEKISNITILGLSEVYWSPTRDRAAVFYLDQENRKGFIQSGTSSVSILPPNIKSFSWSPDGKYVAFLTAGPFGLDVVVADALGKNPKTIFSTPVVDFQVKWVSADKIILQSPTSGIVEGSVFSISRTGGSFKKIIGPLFGLDTNWSPAGLYSLINRSEEGGKQTSSFVSDSDGKEIFKTNFPIISNKCFWINTTKAYCAVPRNITRENIFPDEYFTGELNTADQVVLIDILLKNIYGVYSEASLDMMDLQITKDEKNLFFVNRKDGTLWQLQLK